MYDTNELKKKAFSIIKKDEDIVFMYDITNELGISDPTFYDHFPKGSKDYKDIEDLLIKNRSKGKKKLRMKWRKSDSDKLQMILYRLFATEMELEKITGNKKDDNKDKIIEVFLQNYSKKKEKK